MKKHLLLVGTLAISMLSAQNNEGLKREFERQNKENSVKFDSYVAKKYGRTAKSADVQAKIEEQRAKLAGFSPNGRPYFFKSQETRQNSNANADVLNTAGGVSGLAGAFKGEGIKFTIFDGGRVYAAHPAFDNATGRITNKEAATNIYSGHSTGVAGFIGSRSLSSGGTLNGVQVTFNVQGVAPNSTMDSYKFDTTVLPGASTTSTVYQKIVAAAPKISNHSYGASVGWNYDEDDLGNPRWVWGGIFESPNTTLDLQGSYLIDDQNYDNIVYANPSYVIVKSAGNSYGDGPNAAGTSAFEKYYFDDNDDLVEFTSTDVLPQTNCAQGFDCIGPGSLAKNIIVVGATDVITTNNNKYVTSSDVVHSSYSSAGPRDDGGIKPDISTTGTNVFLASTAENTTGSSAFNYGSGTSYSAPVVTGVIGLWMQIYKQLFNNADMNAASAKTLMIHSALEAGTVGPDPHFGWGYIDAKKGAELLVGKSNNSVIFNDETLNNEATNTKTVKASGSTPLKVTISWIDPAFNTAGLTYATAYNNRNSRLVNDLDLRITDVESGTVYLPWKLNATSPMVAQKGDNTVDNVEQVIVDVPVAGKNYKIEVKHKGALKNSAGAIAPQNYSIIVTGHTEVLGTKEAAKADALNSLSVAPSVTKDVTNILNAPKKSTFTVYDMSGKKLQSGNINSDKEAINLSAHPKGIYIIEVKTDKDVVAKKVIKE